MLSLQVKPKSNIHRFLSQQDLDLSLPTRTPEEKVTLLILRDLLRLGWQATFSSDRVTIIAPTSYDKDVIKSSMQIKRQEQIFKKSDWISAQLPIARMNLTEGSTAWASRIEPTIEVCKTKKQFDLFRVCRFYWSSPYSEYVGRRIKFLIRDSSLPRRPLIGIAALGSSIVHIPERDKWIGWDTRARTANLVYTMDAFVIGALPPYNYLLGGKLISYILASNEVREIFYRKYKGQLTNISKRMASRLACIFTTSLYGKSSQYNRLKFNDQLLYIPVGKTKGYGTLHLTDETFNAMRELLGAHNIAVTNRFGDGPIWRMRVIRTASDLLGLNSDFLLRHSFQRNIYVVPLAHNFRQFLKGEHKNLNYFNYSLEALADYWRNRWLSQRRKHPEVRSAVLGFRPEDFSIQQ